VQHRLLFLLLLRYLVFLALQFLLEVPFLLLLDQFNPQSSLLPELLDNIFGHALINFILSYVYFSGFFYFFFL